MSPHQPTSFSDPRSEKIDDRPSPRRGRPPASREKVLEAADRLLAEASSPATVTMDDIAAAAGVGKGTLFRAFASRAGLVGALFELRSQPLRDAVLGGPPPLGSGGPPAERFVAVLDALADWKLAHPHLIAALDLSGAELLASDFYRWIHGLLADLVHAALPDAGAAYPAFAAHAALGTMRLDLTQALTAEMSRAQLRAAQADYARRLVDASGSRG